MSRRLLTIGHSYGVAMNRVLADAIASQGWEVTVAAPERVATDRGVVALQAAAGPARVVPIPVSWPGRIHWMGYGGRLRSLLAEGWDVVHCWEEPFVRSAWQVARWSPPAARLVYATFQNLPKRYPPPFAGGERRAMRRADGWIAFGRTVAETLEGRPEYAARPHRIIPPPVDTARFVPDPAARGRIRAELGWADDGPPVVGYVGRMVPEKGLDVLTRALDRVDGWRALLVGDGPLRGELEGWAARSGRARVVSGVGHDQVPAYLAALDLLVVPSLTTPRWREQFGRVLIEAMACGVPVLGSDSGEILHVIGDAGVVAPEGNVESWVGALQRLLGDPATRTALGARGRARAAAHFAPAVVARHHLEFFESLLSAGTAS